MAERYVIGIDVGTTDTKAILFPKQEKSWIAPIGNIPAPPQK